MLEILDYLSYIRFPIKWLLQLLGYELVKKGKIEFNCKQAQYYPTPQKEPFVIVDFEVNNLSSGKDTLTEVLLEIKNNKYQSRCYNPIPRKERREFIRLPFQINSRGEGYSNRPLYFAITDGSLELKDFVDSQGKIIRLPAKLIVKRATSKKEHIINITVNLAPSEDWPLNNTAEQLAKLYSQRNKLYEEHL